jgi:hypothetical protein
MFDASNHISMGENGNTQGGGLLSRKGAFARDTAYYTTGRIAGPGGMHPARFGDDKWVGGGRGSGMSAPEPGSLMLLSTGLIGIAGMMRRRLLRGKLKFGYSSFHNSSFPLAPLIAVISANLMAAFFFLIQFRLQESCNFPPIAASHVWPCGIRATNTQENSSTGDVCP